MRQAKVLLIGSNPDETVVAEILARFAPVTRARELPTALPAWDAYDAVFCEWEFAGGTWRDVLEKTKELDRLVPVIVLSHCGSDKQWIEVLQAGAFDLLVPPYTNYQVLAVLEHAIASRPRIADCVAA